MDVTAANPGVTDPLIPDLEIPVAFNEPRFVTWWLGTLYLFRPSDQVAIAQLLMDAVHTGPVSREIQAFIELHQIEGDTLDAAGESPVDPLLSGDPRLGIALVRSRLIELGRANPWMLGAGLAAIAWFIAKGAWFIGTELFRIVF